ncbi:MAG: hypothetical protein R2867_02745 [Caldilineaceae bacterium]
MQVCSIALILEAHIAHSAWMNRYYDIRDAWLEGNALQAMLEGNTVPQHVGVHAVALPAEQLSFEPLDVEGIVQQTMTGGDPQIVTSDHDGSNAPNLAVNTHPFAATVAATMQPPEEKEV